MEGMLRALQPDIMAYVGALMFALVFYVLSKYFARKAIALDESESDVRSTSRVINWIVLMIVIITLITAVFRIATYASVNRMPRNDVEGSAVYDRMNENAHQPTPAQKQ